MVDANEAVANELLCEQLLATLQARIIISDENGATKSKSPVPPDSSEDRISSPELAPR